MKEKLQKNGYVVSKRLAGSRVKKQKYNVSDWWILLACSDLNQQEYNFTE